MTITPLDYNLTRQAVLAEMEQWQFQLPGAAAEPSAGPSKTFTPDVRIVHKKKKGGCAMNRFLLFGLTVAVLVGCSAQESARPAAPPQPVAKAPPPPPPPPPPSLEKPPEPAREKAAVGVGEKGRGYREIYPAATYWAIGEKITFEILIPKAMQLFKATEGRARRTTRSSCSGSSRRT